jgi:CheY-like chemotaxis protein
VRPDLVLTDFHLRGSANGIEAISRIRRKIGSPLAGFLLTGDTDPEHVVKTRRAGCGLLYKPFDPERLRKALAQALGAQ